MDRAFQGFTPEGERTLDWARRIVGDARAMKQEINGLEDKLSGEIRIAAIPTVLGMMASLTTPFRARYPDVRFQITSCTSAEVLGLLENLEVDAGLTYIENEPIGKVRTIPLYSESYRLLTSPDAMFGDREQVTWKEVGQVPLCLLTPDMQNRRIIDRTLRSVGVEVTPTLTSNSLQVLYTHVKTGRWASVMPAKLAETLGLADTVRSIPIIDPIINYGIGMVIPQRDPMTPLIAALVQIARKLRRPWNLDCICQSLALFCRSRQRLSERLQQFERFFCERHVRDIAVRQNSFLYTHLDVELLHVMDVLLRTDEIHRISFGVIEELPLLGGRFGRTAGRRDKGRNIIIFGFRIGNEPIKLGMRSRGVRTTASRFVLITTSDANEP